MHFDALKMTGDDGEPRCATSKRVNNITKWYKIAWEQCFCAGICVMGIKIHTRVTPDRTSSSDIRLCPSRRSSYRSVMCFLTLGTRRQEGEEGERQRKRQRKRKLIPHSNHPSVDSTLLTSVRLLAPQPAGPVTAVAKATEKKHQLCGLLSALPWHCLSNDFIGQGWKGWDATWRRLLLTRWLSSRNSISAALVWKWDASWGGWIGCDSFGAIKCWPSCDELN